MTYEEVKKLCVGSRAEAQMQAEQEYFDNFVSEEDKKIILDCIENTAYEFALPKDDDMYHDEISMLDDFRDVVDSAISDKGCDLDKYELDIYYLSAYAKAEEKIHNDWIATLKSIDYVCDSCDNTFEYRKYVNNNDKSVMYIDYSAKKSDIFEMYEDIDNLDDLKSCITALALKNKTYDIVDEKNERFSDKETAYAIESCSYYSDNIESMKDFQNVINELVEEKLSPLQEAYSHKCEVPYEPNGKTVVLDTETTGLHGETEILQLSIIDVETEEVLWDKLYKPDIAKRWDGAESVNHISPERVKNCGSIIDDLADIAKILQNADKVIAYNTAFDISLLERYGMDFSHTEIDDPMCYGAVIYGEKKYPYRNGEHDYSEAIGYKWQKLKNLAEWSGFDGNGWHNSTADCLATAYLYKRLREPDMLKKYEENKNANPDFLQDDRYTMTDLKKNEK